MVFCPRRTSKLEYPVVLAVYTVSQLGAMKISSPSLIAMDFMGCPFKSEEIRMVAGVPAIARTPPNDARGPKVRVKVR